MSAKKPGAERPEIFRYHSYQAFLKDWLAYRKASQSGFSMRALAKLAGLAAGYLPTVLSGRSPLTGKSLDKLKPYLGLSASEQSFLECLLTLGTSDSAEARLAALERMKWFSLYRKHNRRETEVYEYLTHWYYVAIREMAALEDFRPDAEWIQARLRAPVPLKQVKEALDFLLEHGYVELGPDGRARPPEKALECTVDVYKLAVGKFHRETLALAGKSIDNTPSGERNLAGHTFALKMENYGQAKEILDEAIRKVRALGENEKAGDSVYHMEIALFPLTTRRTRK